MTKELTKKQTAEAPAVIDFAADAGQGFEEMSNQDFLIPLMKVLQSNSPQIDPDSDKYVEGAQQGMLLNTATEELAKEFKVIPAYYCRREVEWRPKELGGGVVAEHVTAPKDAVKHPEKPILVRKNGNEVVTTLFFYCILIGKNGPEQIVIPMSSTMIKVGRKWNSMMANILLDTPRGRVKAPMFSHIYTIGSVTTEKNGNKWKIYQIKDKEVVTDADVYNMAKQFREVVASGSVKADHNSGQDEETNPEDEDF